MNTTRKPIRASTKIVGRSSPQTNWTLERVQLINKHAAQLRNAETNARVRADMARQNGRQDALNEIAGTILSDGEFRKEFSHYAAAALGAEAGRHMNEWMRHELNPVLVQQRKITDALLTQALVSAEIQDRRVEKAVTIRVDFRPASFAFRQAL